MSELVANLIKELIRNGGAEGAPLDAQGINALLSFLHDAGWVLAEDVPGFVRVH